MPGRPASSYPRSPKPVAISPPTDIVLGVALAAEPDKYRVAVERLRRLSALGQADLESAQWEGVLAREAVRSAPQTAMGPAHAVATQTTNAVQRRERGPDAFGQLEAFVLQSFIQSMLPKNATHVFGKGTAGEVWKSMMAEKLGRQIADSGQVGLAERLRSGLAATRLGGAVPPSPALASVLPYLQSAAGTGSTPGPQSPKGVES